MLNRLVRAMDITQNQSISLACMPRGLFSNPGTIKKENKKEKMREREKEKEGGRKRQKERREGKYGEREGEIEGEKSY